AEEGIRDRNVSGVQTCALPIFFLQQREIGVRNREVVLANVAALREDLRQVGQSVLLEEAFGELRLFALGPQLVDLGGRIVGIFQIGRASCRVSGGRGGRGGAWT